MRVSDFHVGKIMVCGLCFFLFSAQKNSLRTKVAFCKLELALLSTFLVFSKRQMLFNSVSETAAFVLHDFSNNNCATPFFPG